MTLVREPDNIEFPSDILSVVYEPFDGNGAWQFKLAQELKAVGYEVDSNKLL